MRKCYSAGTFLRNYSPQSDSAITYSWFRTDKSANYSNFFPKLLSEILVESGNFTFFFEQLKYRPESHHIEDFARGLIVSERISRRGRTSISGATSRPKEGSSTSYVTSIAAFSNRLARTNQ
jgi:hypothetical protein